MSTAEDMREAEQKAQGARLKAARLNTGLDVATAAKRSSSKGPTYYQYENGRRSIKQVVGVLAQAVDAPAEWLLFGVNPPDWFESDAKPRRGKARAGGRALPERPTAPLLGYVGAGDPIEAIADSDPRLVDVPAGFEGLEAYRIRGRSCEPVFDNDDIVFVRADFQTDEANFINRYCVVITKENNAYVKQVVEGRPAPAGQGRQFTLRSPNADDLPIQNIRSARPVVMRIIRGGR